VALRLLNPAAVKKQVDSKVRLVQQEIEKLRESLRERFLASIQTRTPDALLVAIQAMRKEKRSSVQHIGAMMDDLTGFLDQNSAYAETLGFSDTRAWLERTRKLGEADLKKLEEAITNIRDVTVRIDAGAGDWQELGVSANKGDLIGSDARGRWRLGPLAGESGPSGLNLREYDGHSLFPAYPHGCLLIRVGEKDVLPVLEAGVGSVPGEGGTVSARCNDRGSDNNSGSIQLRVVVVPIGK